MTHSVRCFRVQSEEQVLPVTSHVFSILGKSYLRTRFHFMEGTIGLRDRFLSDAIHTSSLLVR
jgi:hypothetical protein